MAFSGNYVCTSFKEQLLTGVHDFSASGGDTFKLALCTSGETLDAATDSYADLAFEVSSSGTAYTTGGNALTNVEPTSTGTTAFVDFDPDVTWAASTITARGGLIYNSTPGGTAPTTPAVVVLDFGSDKSSASGDFTVMFPAADSSNAIIRIA